MNSVANQLLSWMFFGVKAAGCLLAALSAVLYVNQDKLLYIPNPPGFPKCPKENPPGFTSPGEWSKTGRMINSRNMGSPIPYEEHFVQTTDGKKIHVWLMLKETSERLPTLIYFHGNAGNMGFRLKNAAEMFAKVNMNILMMDYRGYGSSEGDPSETGLNLDADAVLQFAVKHPKLSGSRIIAFGRSLGGAVSVALAHRHPTLVHAVVLENTFSSVGAMVDVLMPYICALKGLVLRIKWDSDAKIGQLEQPILFVSGDSDQLVPPQHMKRLHELALRSRGKVFFRVLGGTHNDTWEVAGEEYYRRLKQFIQDNGLAGAPSVEAATAADNRGDASPQRCSSGGSGGEEEDVEDPDYLIIGRDKVASLPTMDTSFRVTASSSSTSTSSSKKE